MFPVAKDMGGKRRGWFSVSAEGKELFLPVPVQEGSGFGLCLVTDLSYQLLLPGQEKRSSTISLFWRMRNLLLLPVYSPRGERLLCQQVPPAPALGSMESSLGESRAEKGM